ncbi:hypothetical protein [Anaerobium acetethylicum]|nr:hypothetical protein [Anaerobium acetethylicum]
MVDDKTVRMEPGWGIGKRKIPDIENEAAFTPIIAVATILLRLL